MGLNAAAPDFSPGGFTACTPAPLPPMEGGNRARGGGSLNPGQLTNAIKGCRALGELAYILKEQVGAINHIHVSAAWGCLVRVGRSRGGEEMRGVVEVLTHITRDVLGKMGGREIANVMHSMSKLQKMGARLDLGLLEAMQVRASATVGEFKPQEVSNFLWALATMGARADRELLEAMQRRATATVGGFEPQGVSNLLWALATMGVQADRGLVEAMQRRATATAGEFGPQG
ncbi:hypothetical protein T484DRAFT_1825843, partial [Baffinella frigidus]